MSSTHSLVVSRPVLTLLVESDEDSDAELELELERQRATERAEAERRRERKVLQTKEFVSCAADGAFFNEELQSSAMDRLKTCLKRCESFTESADAELLGIVVHDAVDADKPTKREAKLARLQKLEAFKDTVREMEGDKARITVCSSESSSVSICALMTSCLQEVRVSPTSVCEDIPCCSGSPFLVCGVSGSRAEIPTTAKTHSGKVQATNGFKKRKGVDEVDRSFKKKVNMTSIAAATMKLMDFL